ncbi:MAG: peptide ABC transporter substrate-binding protein [Puniceicoccales bacterium]|jgi:oligopeptide transport system substrate-binding protein|nr:peptide ABC transporter substrate-binding protein [Puniceicoccales bacterium]
MYPVSLKFRWLVALLLCLIFIGCGKEEPKKDRKVLIICTDIDVTSLNPHIASGLGAPNVFNAIFEGLVVPDPETYRPLPGVADRWSVSENGKVYEFHLRDNARWSNGDLLNAEDFVISVKRALSSKLSHPNVEMFFPLKNAEKFYRRQVRNFNEVGIHSFGKHTLRIELENPLNAFIYVVMEPCWYPLNDAVYESINRFNDRSDFFPNIISNGPFMVVNKRTDNNVVLEKNPYYWDYETTKLDEIKFIVGFSIERSFNMFRNGSVDICMYNPQSAYYSSDLIDEECIKSEIRLGCFYLILNTKNKPLDDKNVRMALSMAIRRKTLLDLMSMTGDSAAYSLIPTLGPDYKASMMFSEEQARARELLAIAGYKDGENFPKIRFICNNSRRQDMVCSFVKNELKDILNVDVDIEYVRRDDFMSMRKEGDFDICCGDWYGDYPDPEKFLKLFTEKSQQNYSKWHSDEYDGLLKMAYYMRDDKERLRLLKNAEQLLMSDMPVIPLYFESSFYLMKKRVKGWDSNLLDLRQWKLIDVEEE